MQTASVSASLPVLQCGLRSIMSAKWAFYSDILITAKLFSCVALVLKISRATSISFPV